MLFKIIPVVALNFRKILHANYYASICVAYPTPLTIRQALYRYLDPHVLMTLRIYEVNKGIRCDRYRHNIWEQIYLIKIISGSLPRHTDHTLGLGTQTHAAATRYHDAFTLFCHRAQREEQERLKRHRARLHRADDAALDARIAAAIDA